MCSQTCVIFMLSNENKERAHTNTREQVSSIFFIWFFFFFCFVLFWRRPYWTCVCTSSVLHTRTKHTHRTVTSRRVKKNRTVPEKIRTILWNNNRTDKKIFIFIYWIILKVSIGDRAFDEAKRNRCLWWWCFIFLYLFLFL